MLQVKGSAAAPATVSIAAAITAWGGPLLSALAQAVGVPGVAEVWIQRGEAGSERKLEGDADSRWDVLELASEKKRLVLVVGSAIPLSRTLHDSDRGNRARGGGEARPLPDGEQRFKRLGHLIIAEPTPRLFQKVGPHVHAVLPSQGLIGSGWVGGGGG